MKLENIENYVSKCKTAKQVIEFLNKNGIKYTDNSLEGNYNAPKTKDLDILLNDFIRIYYSKYDKCYIVQKRVKYTEIPNGNKRTIPICYGHYKTINDYDTIITENTQVEF